MSKVYGLHAVTQFLKTSPEEANVLCVHGDSPRINEVTALAKRLNIRIERITKKELDERAQDGNHQGVMLDVADKAVGDEKSLKTFLETLPPNPVILILDSIQDPHNLGACLRSAAAFGVNAVVWPKDKQAQLTPVVHKVASGAVERLNLFVVTNLSRAMEAMQQAGIWIVGTILNETAKPLSDIDLKGPIAIVMGSEGEGLRMGTQKQCDFFAYIPMQNDIQSLNVSVATGVALYEVRRQR
ncbi:MAG: 23S rRNA (guanosine(2251)-2'-O)-methyltransferase RlmB [Gammaproteobacteria bacterium]